MFVYVRAKFQVSSIILTSFRRGSFTTPPPPPPQSKPLKSPPRSRLIVLSNDRLIKPYQDSKYDTNCSLIVLVLLLSTDLKTNAICSFREQSVASSPRIV